MNLTKLEKRLLDFFEQHPEQSFTMNEIAQRFNFRGTRNFKRMVKAIAFLERQGFITISDRGKVTLKMDQSQTIVEGTFRGHERGFGFVSVVEGEPDLFIPPGKTGNALDGDTVQIKVFKQVDPQTGKGSLAEVTKIIERGMTQVIGEFKPFLKDQLESNNYVGYLIPQDKQYQHLTIYIEDGGIECVDQTMVVARITEFPTHQDRTKMVGVIVKEIGHKNAPGIDILSILFAHGIPHEFPQTVKDQLPSIPSEVTEADLKGRIDLRDALTFTIDGADAKDIDDAISLTMNDNGTYRLGVHIADVSHYVTERSAIDAEAYERGTSVYLADRVVPMLPPKLSNGICSLNPDVDRLTKTCEMVINERGKVIDYKIYDSVIQSKYRMTYDDVNAIYNEDEQLTQTYAPLVETLWQMKSLHDILAKKRQQRGAIDFDSEETQIVLDDHGHPIDIVPRTRGIGERLIESFMLIANETVATYFKKHDFPALYRIHEQPDVEKIDRFAEFITTFGLILRGKTELVSSKQLQGILDKARDEPYEPVLSMMLLRSMQQAKYDAEPVGHYGLATEDYTHFTAPIRRYPDLIVHRLLTLYQKGTPKKSRLNQLEATLPEIGEHTSRMERRAIEAERETVAMKKAEFMLDKIGEVFDGQISSVTSFGIFVKLDNSIEGFIRIEDIPGDYYHFDERHLMLLGERTRTIYQIGQSVTIEVINVSVAERQIDFRLLEADRVDVADLSIKPNFPKKRKSSNRKQRRRRQRQRRSKRS